MIDPYRHWRTSTDFIIERDVGFVATFRENYIISYAVSLFRGSLLDIVSAFMELYDWYGIDLPSVQRRQ